MTSTPRKATHKYQCPWCEEYIEPIQNDGSGVSQFISNPHEKDAHWLSKNPAMCPECLGVGGWEDFTLIARASSEEK